MLRGVGKSGTRGRLVACVVAGSLLEDQKSWAVNASHLGLPPCRLFGVPNSHRFDFSGGERGRSRDGTGSETKAAQHDFRLREGLDLKNLPLCDAAS